MAVPIQFLSMAVSDDSATILRSSILIIHYLLTHSLGGGNDVFDIVSNRCSIDLNGESGNDTFVLRSFVSADSDTLSPG